MSLVEGRLWHIPTKVFRPLHDAPMESCKQRAAGCFALVMKQLRAVHSSVVRVAYLRHACGGAASVTGISMNTPLRSVFISYRPTHIASLTGCQSCALVSYFELWRSLTYSPHYFSTEPVSGKKKRESLPTVPIP